MKITRKLLVSLPLLLGPHLLAQPQIGGGTCTSSSLSGTYSLTLSGRDVSSAVGFTTVVQGIGSATFDGLSKVTFSLTNNAPKLFNMTQTMSGTYSLQSNCIGVVNITVGDTATFTLGSFNQGVNYFISGQDGVYSYIGNGSALPASCSASLLAGTYEFNGNGFTLASGAIGGVNYISGLMTFDGTSVVTTNWYVSSTGTPKNSTGTGNFTVTSGCTASATVTDSSGNTYSLNFVLTSAKESTFLVNGANGLIIFTGSGRIL